MNTREKAFQALAKTGSCNAELILSTLEAAGLFIAEPLRMRPVLSERGNAELAFFEETDGPGWDEQQNDAPTYRHRDLYDFFVRGWIAAKKDADLLSFFDAEAIRSLAFQSYMLTPPAELPLVRPRFIYKEQ